VLAPKVFRRGIPFASGWWAISFPIAALATAALKYSMFVQLWPLKAMAILLLAVLSITITVLLVKTLHYLFNGKLLS
jgi:tellurite resistance protein